MKRKRCRKSRATSVILYVFGGQLWRGLFLSLFRSLCTDLPVYLIRSFRYRPSQRVFPNFFHLRFFVDSLIIATTVSDVGVPSDSFAQSYGARMIRFTPPGWRETTPFGDAKIPRRCSVGPPRRVADFGNNFLTIRRYVHVRRPWTERMFDSKRMKRTDHDGLVIEELLHHVVVLVDDALDIIN